jgi:HEAT repeat protein
MDQSFETLELSREDIEGLTKKKAIDLVEVVKKGLWDGRLHVRRNSALALVATQCKGVTETYLLPVAAKDSDPIVRTYILEALAYADLPPNEQVQTLFVGTCDKNQAVHDRAIETLLKLLDKPKNGVAEATIDALGDLRPIIQVSALSILLRKAEHVKGPLCSALRHSNGIVRKNVRQILRMVGEQMTSELVALLSEPDLQETIFRIMSHLRRVDEKAEKTLEELVHGDDAGLGRKAGKLLTLYYKHRSSDAGPVTVDIPHFGERPLDTKELNGAKKGADVGALVISVRDGNTMVRRNSAALLALAVADESGRKAAVEALAPLAKDPNLDVRATVVRTLGTLSGAEAIPVLLVASSDKDRGMEDAIRESIGEAATTSAEALVSGLTPDHAPITHRIVVTALAKAGAKAIPGLVKALQSASGPMVRRAAAAALGRMEKVAAKAVPALAEALAFDGDEEVRQHAARALGKIGIDGDEVRPVLMVAKQDSVGAVRQEASFALDKLDGKPPRLEALQPKPFPISGFDEEIIDLAAMTKAATKIDAMAMRLFLSDGRRVVRINAATALAALGEKAHDSIHQLALLLKDGEVTVREAAVAAIHTLKVDPETCVPALLSSLEYAPGDLLKAALAAIEAYGKNAVQPLLRGLSQRPERVRKTVLLAARHLGDALTKPMIALITGDGSPVQKENAVDVIASLGDSVKGAETALLEALDNDDVLFRVKVIEALGRVAKPSDKLEETLKTLEEKDKRPSVQIAMRTARMHLRSRSA